MGRMGARGCVPVAALLLRTFRGSTGRASGRGSSGPLDTTSKDAEGGEGGKSRNLPARRSRGLLCFCASASGPNLCLAAPSWARPVLPSARRRRFASGNTQVCFALTPFRPFHLSCFARLLLNETPSTCTRHVLPRTRKAGDAGRAAHAAPARRERRRAALALAARGRRAAAARREREDAAAERLIVA